MLTWAAPWCFAILPLPLILRAVLLPHSRTRDSVRVPMFDVLVTTSGQTPGSGASIASRSIAAAVVLTLAWIAIVAALAQPQWLLDPISRDVATRDLLLAVDLSGSMETEDFTDESGKKTDRMTATKQVLDSFLQSRHGDRVGMVVFGNGAFVQVPFTQDLDVCRELLADLEPRMAGPKTALGDAIGLSINLFDRSEMESKVLIAMTDGNDTGSRVPPAQAAKIAANKGIIIHTIGVGDPEAAGEQTLDETELKAIASETGGQFFRAQDRDALQSVYTKLDAMDTRTVETISHRPRKALYPIPLAASLALSVGYQTLAMAWALLRRRRLVAVAGSESMEVAV
ncbi:von Willebrand factor type A domain protein [Rubripirellula tenax]|uniref:von Willebrand factor type A domain protein n=1 Tax=Rubripirellula tenax TaxID=2528015 RepID=A0A5C6FDC1_9BACT|nr:VWA domain-containing protein [Rubripirellula tenax]TWU58580.1 von Willebrand factor type A domain protein [Rubripirellula tenax]